MNPLYLSPAAADAPYLQLPIIRDRVDADRLMTSGIQQFKDSPLQFQAQASVGMVHGLGEAVTAGLSLFGTALSAITFMAIPSKAYATNWSYVLFNTGIVFVAPVIVYVFIPFSGD